MEKHFDWHDVGLEGAEGIEWSVLSLRLLTAIQALSGIIRQLGLFISHELCFGYFNFL